MGRNIDSIVCNCVVEMGAIISAYLFHGDGNILAPILNFNSANTVLLYYISRGLITIEPTWRDVGKWSTRKLSEKTQPTTPESEIVKIIEQFPCCANTFRVEHSNTFLRPYKTAKKEFWKMANSESWIKPQKKSYATVISLKIIHFFRAGFSAMLLKTTSLLDCYWKLRLLKKLYAGIDIFSFSCEQTVLFSII